MAVGVGGGALPAPYLVPGVREGELLGCQLTPPWPQAELWVTPNFPEGFTIPCWEGCSRISSEETEAQRGLEFGPKLHSLLVVALGESGSPQNIFPVPSCLLRVSLA